MRFEDLTPCTYSGDSFTEPSLAVGWLDSQDYSKGAVSEAWIKKLLGIYRESSFREDLHYRGLHPCPFCGVYANVETPFGTVHIGARNILVPSADALFYSPSTIIHYVLSHGYRPPDRYVRAVESADLGSPGFVDGIVKTFKFSCWDPNGYEIRLGDLIATQNGLLGLNGLRGKLREITVEVIPGAAGRWPPKAGVSEQQSAEIARRFKPTLEAELRDVKELVRSFDGTKWHKSFAAYLTICSEVTAPKPRPPSPY